MKPIELEKIEQIEKLHLKLCRKLTPASCVDNIIKNKPSPLAHPKTQ